MHKRIAIFLVLLINLAGCASSGPKVRMLNERADHEFDDQMRMQIGTSDGPVWKGEKTTVCYIHPHSTPDGGWFHGGYMSIRYEEPSWIMQESKEKLRARRPQKVKKKVKK